MKMTKAEALHHAKVLDYMHSEAFGMGDSNPIGKTAMESIAAAARFLRDAVEAEPVAWQLIDSPEVVELDEREYHSGTEWEPLYTSQLVG